MGFLSKMGGCALALALLPGCSSSDSSKAATTTTTTVPGRVANVEQVRAELKPVIDAQCQWLFKCCTDGELAQQLGPATSADCADHLFQSATVSFTYGLTLDTSTQNLLVALNYVQYGFDRSTITIDGAAVSACAAKISAQACNPAPPLDHCAPAAPVPDDPCAIDKLLLGSLPAGADCTANGANECAPGLICRSVASEAGVCIPAPAVGDLCLRDEDCGSLICAWETGKCAAGAAYSAACSFSDPAHPVPGTEATRCGPGLACDTIELKCTDSRCAAGNNCSTDADCPVGVACIANSCGPLKNVGETCNQTSDCAAGVCNYDPLARRQLCTAPKAQGAACQQASDCASGFCQYDQTALVSLCAPTQKTGDPCPSGQGEECDSGKCFEQVCTAVKAGDACSGDSDCARALALFCVDQACRTAPFSNNSACTSDEQCKSGACVALKCTAKGGANDPCGAVKDAPCEESSFCELAAGKDTGKCAAKKAQGELCTRDLECVSSCAASHGELRCAGEPAGTALCGG